MGVFFEDNFVDTAGTLLDAHTPDTGTGWTEHVDSAATQQVEIRTSGLASAKQDSYTRALYYADAPGDSTLYRAELKVVHTGGGDNGYDVGPCVRMQTANSRSYRVTTNLGNPRLSRATPAAQNTNLASFTGAAAFDTSGQFAILKIEAEGTTLRGTYTDHNDDVFTVEVVDSINGTGGRPGLWCLSRDFKCDFDYFIASDGVEGGGGVEITASGAVQGLSTSPSSVSLDAGIDADIHSSELSVSASTVSLNRVLGCAVQSISLTVSEAGLSSDRNVSGSQQQIALQSVSAGISLSKSVSAAVYSAELQANKASLSLGTSLQAQLAEVALLASVATVSQGVQSGLSESNLSTSFASVTLDITLSGSLENIGLTTLAASVGLASEIDAFSQAISLTPNGVELIFGSEVSANTASAQVTPFLATLTSSESALLVPGLEYTIPGNLAHFTVPVSKTGYTIPISRIHFTFLDED